MRYSACPGVMYQLPILCTPALQVKTSCILMVCSRSRHVLQYTATHCNTPQQTATYFGVLAYWSLAKWRALLIVTLCNMMQHCNTLQKTSGRLKQAGPLEPREIALIADCITLQHTATHTATRRKAL